MLAYWKLRALKAEAKCAGLLARNEQLEAASKVVKKVVKEVKKKPKVAIPVARG